MSQCLIPTPIRPQRGLLWLIGYNKCFIKGYGTVVAPLTKLLKKKGFKWIVVAEQVFHALKNVVINAPILSLPNFTIPFEVECDSSMKVMCVVLMPKEYLIAYYSQALKGRALNMCIYKNIFFGLVSTVLKWRPYHL